MSNCLVCGNYVPEGRLICTYCETNASKYNDPSKKSNIAIKVLNRINSEGKLDYNDYVELYDAIILLSQGE